MDKYIGFDIDSKKTVVCVVQKADDITVSNPTKMTWIYRTSKKNNRIDARNDSILFHS